MVTFRLLLLLLVIVAGIAFSPAFAAPLTLRGEVSVASDVITLADLVEGATGAGAQQAMFRAPELGERGTIQVRRVVDAAARLGLGRVDTAGRFEVKVERAGRVVQAPEMEAAVKAALSRAHGLDVATLAIAFDGLPTVTVPAEITAQAVAEDVVYDRRSRRVTALVRIGSEAMRGRSTRVSGALVETLEVAVLVRSLARGDTVSSADLAIERRGRETVPADAPGDVGLIAGQVARRALGAGTMLRASDLVRPELVGRGEPVLIVYEAPGLTLTLRGKANEAGARGDVITVQNLQSKKVLQATVTGPGSVTVKAAMPGRIASATP